MNMHKGTVTLILTKDLKMKATYAKMVKKITVARREGKKKKFPKLKISLKG
jgi:hypothetical protein